MIKWVAAVIGLIYMRIPGAIVGFLLGSVLEVLLKRNDASAPFQKMFQQEERVSRPVYLFTFGIGAALDFKQAIGPHEMRVTVDRGRVLDQSGSFSRALVIELACGRPGRWCTMCFMP